MTRKIATKKLGKPKRSFGGRSTASGVGYEVEVAAWVAVKMLIGGGCVVFDGLAVESVTALAPQTEDLVDDVVLDLRDSSGAKVFISAKRRTGAVSISPEASVFKEVVHSMVDQYHALPDQSRGGSRFVWALPSTAGRAATYHLPEALRAYRAEMPVTDLKDFLQRRSAHERSAISALISIIKARWRSVTGAVASTDVVQAIVARIYVEVLDFEFGTHHERIAANELAAYVVASSYDGHRAWACLCKALSDANRRGWKRRCQHLRAELTAFKIRLKSEADYADDLAALAKMTSRNLARLSEHRFLRFGSSLADEIHLPREADTQALTAAVKDGHLLLTGEPGSGKSGLVHCLVENLHTHGRPVVLLLAEEMGGHEWTTGDGIPVLDHALDDVLAHWPDGIGGYLVTDALDAVRDPDLQSKLRRLLASVLQGESNWTVVASVREFDLKHSQQLRGMFPGSGVITHSSTDFAGVAHFHLGRLPEHDLDRLVEWRPEIAPFIRSARESSSSEQLHRSPFFLRLAADLLSSGVAPNRLADWTSPTLLLRRFWDSRIGDGIGDGDRESALQSICRRMMDQRSMTLSIKELAFGSTQRDAVRDLQSRGILQGPAIKQGVRVGDEAVRFSHHLLHDYAMARSLIPSIASRFVAFVRAEPLSPVFYRQSFVMALDELWDGAEGVTGFWRACLEMEQCPQLHSFTRILAPLLAARRVEQDADLLPLLNLIEGDAGESSPAIKAALHLSSGLQDASSEAIRSGASAWCGFVRKLAMILERCPALESPVVFLLARLLEVEAARSHDDRLRINEAGRLLLYRHLTKPVNSGWRYACATAVRAVCRTFDCNLVESSRVLLAMLSPDRVREFPHEDLFDLAHEIEHLSSEGDEVVRRLFEVSFSTEPKSGDSRTNGSLILTLRTDKRDDWNIVRYSLGEYYVAKYHMAPGLSTTLVCIAWNAASERRSSEWKISTKHFEATFTLGGAECNLSSDGCSSWGRQFEHEENTILNAFEGRLRHWCESANVEALTSVIESFARENRSDVMWQVLLEIASEHPAQLGVMLEDAVHQPMLLTMPAYQYGAAALFAALHRLGETDLRERLERTLLDLPQTAPLRTDEVRDPTPGWVAYAQNLLLGELDEANVVLDATKALRLARAQAEGLERNHRPESLTPFVPSLGGSPMREKSSPPDPLVEELVSAEKDLDGIKNRDGSQRPTSKTTEGDLAVMRRADSLIARAKSSNPKQAAGLWGRLTQTCARVVGRTPPARPGLMFTFVRRILLRAASDPIPLTTEADSGAEDNMDTWGWPSPRSDSAEGLPFVVCRLRNLDRPMTKALRTLAKDPSRIVRYELAGSLFALHQSAPQLMWELIDHMIDHESKYRVLDELLTSLGRLLSHKMDALPRIQRIAKRVSQHAPKKHNIHEHLVSCFLFRFLRTGDTTCWDHVANLIRHCDDETNANSLAHQLHSCRKGRWLTAGDAIVSDTEADEHRMRAWRYFRELLSSAQQKLSFAREQWKLLHAEHPIDESRKETVQSQINVLGRIVDGIAGQLYFGSGAFSRKQQDNEDHLSVPQMRRFWNESADLFESLANELHPHTAKHVIEAMYHLMAADPHRTFLCAAKAIETSNAWGFLQESLVVDDIVRLIQRLLSDHSDVLRPSIAGYSECLEALLRVLDLFVDAGWAKARQLTHRLEEIYR